MASREFAAVFFAGALSWLGDYAARAAVTALVYQRTNSVAASSAAFAISYLPWLGIGSLLSSIAERHSYRRVMINCDLLRMVLMALIALISMPVWTMLGLLFLTALLNPPFEAARSALQPQLLDGDRYVVGVAMQRTSAQAAIVLGYVLGASAAGYDARLALLFNAATFGISALLVGVGVTERAPLMTADLRTNLIRETAEGFGVVFRSPVLRAIAIIVFAESFFTVVPEGLAAGWAGELTHSNSSFGFYQALIMMSNPVGWIIGGLLVGRLVAPSTRVRLIRPLAILAPVTLVPAIFSPNVWVIATMNMCCGVAIGGFLPAINGLFVQCLPQAFRARAFGVMQSGTQVVQAIAVLMAGVIADMIAVPVVAGLWGIAGVIALVLASLWWPQPQIIADARLVGGRPVERPVESPAERPVEQPVDRPPAAPLPVEDAASAPPDVERTTHEARHAAARRP
jgi:MFS family permease